MSVVQFPEAMDSSAADLQIWNNAAFDNGEISEDLTSSRQSWGSLKSIFANPNASFDSVSDKENRNLAPENHQIPSVSSSLNKSSSTTTPFKPVNTDVLIQKSRIKKGLDENLISKLEGGKKIRDEKKIDEEIEDIESQICRLSSRLEALRLEKAQRSVKVVEKRGRVVQAKFMEQKQSAKNEDNLVPISSAKTTKVQRRGISLGPAEILSGGSGRRGMSMGPTEIFGAAKSRQLGGNQESMMMLKNTPLQNRRKSCFFKLQEIDEEKAASKERCSLSPKSRKTAARNQFATSRQVVTTISSRKNLKKEDAVISSIQPKKLFKDGEKSTVKKPLIRPGRVVASRYNQSTATTNANGNGNHASAMRKRSMPENDLDESKRDEKKRSLSSSSSSSSGSGDANEKKNLGSETRVKKRWEINPSEIVVHGSNTEVEAGDYLQEFLPRIRIGRCMNESPRDSGPAKKVVELIGRKSFFSSDEEIDTSVCQALSFYPEEEEE